MTTSMGKQLRLARLFDPDSETSLILPMDHGVEEAGFTELERPLELVASLARAGVNGFLTRRGLADFAIDAFAGRAGWVQRLTARTALSPGLDHQQLVVASVDQALHNGADAVVPTFFIGPETEASQLTAFGEIADECNRLAVPLLAEIFPLGGPESTTYNGPYTTDDMRLAVRIASEEGADVIKTWYTGDPSSFSKVVAYSLVPVLIAGGPKARNTRDVLETVRGAMDAGAAGIAMGRKIWQSPDPAGMVRAISAMLRHDASVADALELLAPAPRG
jgi:fructose-bisphosphate aldolase / 2-amino-3,7-dideoxy-D-threo-hept-6-ulosonate synthase